MMKKAYSYIQSAIRKDPITHQGAIWTDWEVKEMIEEAQKDAYNQAIDDICNPDKIDHFCEEDGRGCVIKKGDILKLKK